eukprot:CAMPEP_0202860748 /NCGR_PEP_ID=MMETSP1391-20130828/2363_1 /ASSEMBLY_ACC=CAM_ASM_000867 /TAXON_ID=1034604 /ORGANISM="Chlamydomonas leiostraca, Strain SAG 11-49" /LENGTH=162 /DNA_ID=CAMNT_0049539983 /DNA_START=111 /DNA_END=599 /DNA_ORIENTATION=-
MKRTSLAVLAAALCILAAVPATAQDPTGPNVRNFLIGPVKPLGYKSMTTATLLQQARDVLCPAVIDAIDAKFPTYPGITATDYSVISCKSFIGDRGEVYYRVFLEAAPKIWGERIRQALSKKANFAGFVDAAHLLCSSMVKSTPMGSYRADTHKTVCRKNIE